MEQLEIIFRKHRLRLTSARRALFQALGQADSPLFIYDIVRACPGVNRSSIYRGLEQFHNLDIITVVHTGFKKRYELAGPFKIHHHHFVCDSCGLLTDIHTPNLEHLIDALSRKYGFRVITHHFELHGHCKKCLLLNLNRAKATARLARTVVDRVL